LLLQVEGVKNEEFAMFLPPTSKQPFSSRVGVLELTDCFLLSALRLHPRLDGAQRDLIRWDNLDNL
jgi:hypothetical protein